MKRGLPDDAAATEAMLEAKHFGYGSRFDLDGDAASPTTGGQQGHLHSTPQLTRLSDACVRSRAAAATRAGQVEELSRPVAASLMADLQAPRVLWSRQRPLRHRSSGPGHLPNEPAPGTVPAGLSPAVCGTGPPPASRWPVGPAGLAFGGRLAGDGEPTDG
jgi:hypothetical protein